MRWAGDEIPGDHVGEHTALCSVAHRAAKETVFKCKSSPSCTQILPCNHPTSLPAKAKSFQCFIKPYMVCSHYFFDLIFTLVFPLLCSNHTGHLTFSYLLQGLCTGFPHAVIMELSLTSFNSLFKCHLTKANLTTQFKITPTPTISNTPLLFSQYISLSIYLLILFLCYTVVP